MEAHFDTLQDLTGQLSQRSDAPAVILMQKDGIQQWSFADLSERVRQEAGKLAESNVEPGDHVGLLAENRPEWLVACLAVIEAGGVIVPIDVQFEPDVLEHVLKDSGLQLLFTTTDQADTVGSIDENLQLFLLDEPEDGERSRARSFEREERREVSPDDPAALFYTSGTTGPPKGVPLTHRNLTFQLDTVRDTALVREEDRILLPLPLHHVYPFVIGMLTPLAHGAPIVMPHALTGPQITRALREGDVSVMIAVPRLYRALFEGLEARAASIGTPAKTLFRTGVRAAAELRKGTGVNAGEVLLGKLHERFGPNLRLLASGGSAIDPQLAVNLEGLGWDVAVGYGLTETSPLLSFRLPGDGPLDSVGRPIDETEIRIDEDAADEEGHGEILAHGPGIFGGYHNLPDKTRESFTEEGWFRTGDLGYFDEDGYLHVEGRVSTLIVTEGGENIQPEEIEAVYSEHPVLKEIGVFQHDGKLVGVVVPDPGAVREREMEIEDAVEAAITEQSEKLASYRRIAGFAVTRQALPRTRLGKIRRHELADRYEAALEGEAEARPVPVEEMTADDRELLSDPAARKTWNWLSERYADAPLTPDTSPQLDLGVDSLEWVELTMEIQQRVGIELSDEVVGSIETVRDLLEAVAETAPSEETASPIEEPLEVLSEEQQRWLEPLGPTMMAAANVMYRCNRAFARTYLRLQVHGIDDLDPHEQVVFTPNHRSYLDPFVLSASLPFDRLCDTFWGGLAEAAFANPVFRFFSRLAQAVPVSPQQGPRSSLAYGSAILQSGYSLIWYPEGRRSRDGILQEFRPGIGTLLDAHDVRVVPVRIEGTFDAMPPGSCLPRPHPVSVRFGRPVEPNVLGERGEGENAPERITKALRERIAQMADEA